MIGGGEEATLGNRISTWRELPLILRVWFPLPIVLLPSLHFISPVKSYKPPSEVSLIFRILDAKPSRQCKRDRCKGAQTHHLKLPADNT